MRLPIYMDNHSTTPVDPRVVEKMAPCFTEIFGNASSANHPFGWRAEALVDEAREHVAALIGAEPREIIFTSGATESDNLALLGAAEAYAGRGDHFITVSTEHHAVLDSCDYLKTKGFRVATLAVDHEGMIDPGAVKSALEEGTLLVAVMAANNEIGVVQPLEEIGRICREQGALFFSDAAQAAGKIPLDVNRLRIDLLAISGHKMYGPKGVGALYVRRRDPRARLAPILHGGGQERGLRAGTLNVPGIVGMGEAARLAREEMDAEARRLLALRERLFAGLIERVGGVQLNGHPTSRLPGNLNVRFEDLDGQALMTGLSDVAVSSGSACATADPQPSHVLTAIGLTARQAGASIRFGLGRFNTAEEVDFVVNKIAETAGRIRSARGRIECKT